jgi:hypothetical protein
MFAFHPSRGKWVLRGALPAIALLSINLNAQTPAALANGSYTSAVNGPSAVQQPARVLLNTTGTTYTLANTNVTVTAAISGQQYAWVNTGVGNPVLMFGATVNASGTAALPRPLYANMNDIGTPVNSMYTNQANGLAGGIDVGTNQAFNLFTSINQWAGLRLPATTARTYVADLTLSFSTPLSNPMLNFVGLGGTSGTMGFSTELDLASPGLTLTKLQGNAPFSVSATSINNGNSTGIGAACDAGQAGCGTVRLNGSNISAVKFKIYVRGDTSRVNWSATSVHAGDQWLLGVSLPQTFTVSGNVFNDANGMNDNIVNGTGIGAAGATKLYANLVEPASGKIVGSVPVNASGTFNFDGVPAGANVRLDLSTNQGTQLNAAPARSVPAGWRFTGEHLGTGTGSDGTADGALTFTVNANVANANFGISSAAPTAGEVQVSGRVVTEEGSGILNVLVTLTDMHGHSRTVPSGSLGYFNFPEVESGESYILSVTAKRFQFAKPSMLINVLDSVDDIEFIGY